MPPPRGPIRRIRQVAVICAPPSMVPWAHRSLLPNGILIASDVFAELMVMINIHPRQSVCSNGPHLCNACDAVQKDVKRSRVRVSDVTLSGINLGQVVHTHTRASVTKQHNLAPAKGRRCPTAGKVTVGLEFDWLCCASQTSGVYPPTRSRPKEGRRAPRLYTLLVEADSTVAMLVEFSKHERLMKTRICGKV